MSRQQSESSSAPYKGGRFHNPWPQSQPHGLADFLKWMRTRHQKESLDSPALPITSSGRISDAESRRLTITWVGHSTFFIQAHGLNVLTDPIWSNRASPVQFAGPRRHVPPGVSFEDLPSIDVVFISHDHYDHLDVGTVRNIIASSPRAKWVAPVRVGCILRTLGARDVTELEWWQSTNLGAITASCTPAQHFSGRYPWNRNATLWCGWVIALGRYRVFFAGDTGLHPEFSQIARRFGPFDAAILPIGAYDPRWFMEVVHMSPEDAVSAYLDLVREASSETCVFVPSHWGTFRLTDEPLDEPPRLLSKAWTEAGLSSNRLALLRVGEAFQPDQDPPPG